MLSVMMFLEFFIWGAWFPLVFGYLPSLGFDATQQAFILGAFNLAAFVAMFFSTQFADRHFAAERFLGFSMVVGGLAIFALAFIEPGTIPVDPAKPDGPKSDAPFWPFFGLMLLHALFYVPTISITNSIAFANLKDPQTEFGLVRLWGTIGWIAASWPFVFILADWAKIPQYGTVPFIDWLGAVLGTSKTGPELLKATSYTFVAAGAASLVLAVLSLLLPHTPPRPAKEGEGHFAWLEAMKLLSVPFVLVLFVVTFFDAAVHQCYFFWTPRYLMQDIHIPGNWVMPVMSVGQIAEIGTMAFLGYCLKALGWRYTMVIGILGHAVRFGVFAFAPTLLAGTADDPVLGLTPLQWLAIGINVMHGICYAFFFATVYIFVDEFFPKDARSSAQGLFNFLILGAGPFVGNFVCAYLGEVFKVEEGAKSLVDFKQLFLVPTGVAVVAALFLLLFFHPPERAQPQSSGTA